jgi:oligopeptide/dipeptide ABC transporter ATP-binding protein
VALVGESGSGKSVTALSILQLLPYPLARHPEGSSIMFNGQELIGADVKLLRKVRGDQISMIFQEPMTSLNPLHTVEKQINETLFLHKGMNKDQARQRTLELLKLVGIPDAVKRLAAFPHELSGGQRQRVMIAMALANEPDLLIADEPTTALDVTVQAQILDLIDRLKSEFNAAVIIITHDLGVVAEHCDDIMVMYAGKAAEYGDTDDIYYKPLHPYTWGLLSSIPRLDEVKQERLNPIRGLPPSLIQVPPGCAFHPRCPYKFDPCDRDVPELLPVDGHHAAACHLSLADKERIRDEEVLARR